MNEPSQPYIYKFLVSALTNQARADELQTILKAFPGITQIDINLAKRLIRLFSQEPLNVGQLKNQLVQHKFPLEQVSLPNDIQTSAIVSQPGQVTTLNVCINGMTCRSCELTVERKWKQIVGVKNVSVNASTGRARIELEGIAPSIKQLQTVLDDDKYHVYQGSKKNIPLAIQKGKRPSFWRLVGLFALVFLIGHIFTSLGLLKTNFSVGSNVSFGAIFLIGLVAASSSCIAITGGLLLSAAAKFNERYASVAPMARMRPVFLFIAGRVASYTILGGLLGVVGAALSPSPTVTAIIAIIAALYMFIMGLDMLHIAPSWLKSIMPRMPKSLSHKIMDAEGKEHPLAPIGLGAATFFLPCGFTQALQLYALTTHSFTAGALTLLAFALGTAPALFALGWASNSLKGKAGRFFLQFSGALVVVLGLWNIQNGLTILGYPISFPSLGGSSVAEAANPNDPNVTMDGNTQVVKMAINGGYQPSHVTFRAGKPVRWEIDGTKAGGCTGSLISRQLGIQKFLQPGVNTIDLPPQQPGEIAFSCSMGMIRGSFTVLPPK